MKIPSAKRLFRFFDSIDLGVRRYIEIFFFVIVGFSYYFSISDNHRADRHFPLIKSSLCFRYGLIHKINIVLVFHASNNKKTTAQGQTI